METLEYQGWQLLYGGEQLPSGCTLRFFPRDSSLQGTAQRRHVPAFSTLKRSTSQQALENS
jgi:hypothetical protein